MKRTLRLVALILALLIALPCLAVAEGEDLYEEYFPNWNPEAPALKVLIDYVEAVTDESSPDYIPPADRIATFDMDGTLIAELFPTYLEYYLLARRILTDESWQPDAEMLEFGRMLRDNVLSKTLPSDMPMQHALHAAKAYAGMTLAEFNDFVTRELVREADGFEGMTYAECFYVPMLEIIEYLQANDFICYVVSGSDRFICRALFEGVVDIPLENMIGMDVALTASHEGSEDPLDYVYTNTDQLVRTDELLIKTLKTNKTLMIAREIGRQPVLSFGNTSGDVSMHNYTIFNNRYRSAAFMLIADNEELDYGDTEKAMVLGEQWRESGYNVFSMKNDFRTIYGEGVKKTGTFNWLEELSENRVPAPSEEDTAAEDVQYVMYLGTNDKDTNKPVFTQSEAREQAKAILVRHFGSYTLQEAQGGWLDGNTEYQEYTLVIYLSDTTEAAVHAAADELIEVFDQASVLIQANPTHTEFYTGVE